MTLGPNFPVVPAFGVDGVGQEAYCIDQTWFLQFGVPVCFETDGGSMEDGCTLLELACESVSIKTYANQRRKGLDSASETLEEVQLDNHDELQPSATNRGVDNELASKQVPTFEKHPSAWQAVRYLNLGPAEEI